MNCPLAHRRWGIAVLVEQLCVELVVLCLSCVCSDPSAQQLLKCPCTKKQKHNKVWETLLCIHVAALCPFCKKNRCEKLNFCAAQTGNVTSSWNDPTEAAMLRLMAPGGVRFVVFVMLREPSARGCVAGCGCTVVNVAPVFESQRTSCVCHVTVMQ